MLALAKRGHTARRSASSAAPRLLAVVLGAVATSLSGAPIPVCAQSPPVAEIRLSMRPVAQISPLLYGVNYVWHLIPADRFPQLSSVLRDPVHYTLARYPGGWVAERYDWDRNQFLGEQRRPMAPGVGVEAFLSSAPQASFVTPSAAAMTDPQRIPAVERLTVGLVRRFGKRVRIWEIGNEWWLLNGGKSNPAVRERDLQGYAALVRAEVPALKAADPTIEIYVTGDWTRPAEFADLRRLVGPAAWSSIDGISIHSYCGPRDPERDCSRIPTQVAAIRSTTGKTKIFDSEWAVGRRLALHDFGIRNANWTVLTFQELAFADVTAATYWPPVKGVPATALVISDYRGPTVTGVVFGLMARYYRGEALATSGDMSAVAAKDGRDVTIFVPTQSSGPRTLRIPLAGTGLSRVVSSEILYSPDPDNLKMALKFGTSPLPVSLRRDPDGGQSVEFVVDPGTSGRGASWEIARVTLE